MASGTPLVAPNSGGVTAYAHDGNSWITNATPASFASTVLEILRDSTERERRTIEARRTAERLSWPNVAAGFHDLYRDLHARLQGRPTRFEPDFYSTPGTLLGFEKTSPSAP